MDLTPELAQKLFLQMTRDGCKKIKVPTLPQPDFKARPGNRGFGAAEFTIDEVMAALPMSGKAN